MPPSSGAIMQPIPENSAYERESTVESSASSWSYDFEAPTSDDPNPGETFMDKLVTSSFSNKGTRIDQPMYPLAPITREIFIWTSPATGFQHGNVRYSPEAKQLYPAASTNSLDDGLGLDPFLRGYEMLNNDDLSYSDDGTLDSYGSMMDMTGRMIMFDTPTLADAPWGYQYAPLPIYRALPQVLFLPRCTLGPFKRLGTRQMLEPRNRLWDMDRLKPMGKDHRQVTAWMSPNGSSEYDLPGPSSNERYDVDDREQYRYG